MAVGYPDFTRSIRAQKPSVGFGQDATTYYSETVIAAGSFTDVLVFTMAAGKRIILSSAYICTNASCIQKLEYRPIDLVFMTATYDIFWQLADPDTGAAVFPPGSWLTVRLYNNDVVARTFWITIWGNEEYA